MINYQKSVNLYSHWDTHCLAKFLDHISNFLMYFTCLLRPSPTTLTCHHTVVLAWIVYCCSHLSIYSVKFEGSCVLFYSSHYCTTFCWGSGELVVHMSLDTEKLKKIVEGYTHSFIIHMSPQLHMITVNLYSTFFVKEPENAQTNCTPPVSFTVNNQSWYLSKFKFRNFRTCLVPQVQHNTNRLHSTQWKF